MESVSFPCKMNYEVTVEWISGYKNRKKKSYLLFMFLERVFIHYKCEETAA